MSDALNTLLVFQEFVPSSLDEFPTPVASAALEQLDLGWIYLSSFFDLNSDFDRIFIKFDFHLNSEHMCLNCNKFKPKPAKLDY